MGIVAKYKFDGSVYADLIPEFNAEFTDYTITDEVDSENSNHIIRTIESDSLPTLMRFGVTAENSGTGAEREKSLMEIIELDTSNLTTTHSMFRTCSNLSILHDINTWNVSNVINMASMFGGGCGITSLDLSNWDTSKVITFDSMFSNDRLLTTLKLFKIHSSCLNVYNMFLNCNSITTLDLSSWDTKNIEYFTAIFKGLFNLTSLDISNFSIKSTANDTDMFTNTLSLTDIGMIYCDQSTINKVASLLPTDHNITIWVESDDILQYDQYDHITYKTQKVQDTVHLNSPLLMGDTIEVIDGKTYHVHRWEKVVLDGSESWIFMNSFPSRIFAMSLKDANTSIMCDKIIPRNYSTSAENYWAIFHSANYLRIQTPILTTNEFKQWLSENPTTVVYQLATPYYELISEEPLELTLLDTTDNTINNNSILPSNMTIANKELSTIAIKPSTTYTLSFDKSNVDSEVTIDICGGEQLTTVLNRVELTTPSELGSGIRFISSDGCIVSNVRLLEGSLVKEAIPKKTFEGLKSSFEDGYIIGESLVGEVYHKGNSLDNSRVCKVPISKTLEVNTRYTFVVDVEFEKLTSPLHLVLGDEMAAKYVYRSMSNSGINIYHTIVGNSNITHIYLYADPNADNIYTIKNLILLEGDHTHLSEAELMRYIEKGTSHYEEEDFNHVGKYKVQYKVTGKNKYPTDSIDNPDLLWESSGGGTAPILYNSDEQAFYTEGHRQRCFFNLKPNTPYTVSVDIKRDEHNYEYYDFLFQNYAENISNPEGLTTEWTRHSITRTTDETGYLNWVAYRYCYWKNIQIEEGTVATEYEPYKEDIKTYYLSSPLLKGDTIEDINGVATHVKRYEKVVLDGSENWFAYDKAWGSKLTGTKYNMYLYSDTLVRGIVDPTLFKESSYSIACLQDDYIYISLDGNTAIEQWLQANPTTVVYQLASPIYEPISVESILCDSYVNGHLDLSNENIPIQKVEFKGFEKSLVYSQSSTKYSLQFNSDNVGIINYIDISGTAQTDVKEVTKGINKFNIKTPSNSEYSWLAIYGIGFNASNIQVVEANEDIEFGYFKGLQSSFEDGLVTDVNDENYGKYKVECKIVGKNKFNGELEYGRYNYINGIKDANDNTSYMRFPKLIPIKNGSVRATVFGIDGDVWFVVYNTNGGYIDFGKAYDLSRFDGRVGYISFYMVQPSFADNWYIQIEEGTQATSYEPYKESIHTLYLNSPLLKGDKLVVHDGKLCHYHKMGKVVLDGSGIFFLHEEDTSKIVFRVYEQVGELYSAKHNSLYMTDNNFGGCDNISIADYSPTQDSVYFYITFDKSKFSHALSVDGFKQWFQQNPTTVVYELAEPYYEPIEPQLSQYSFSTVKDGDMEIITVLPIEKINLTYRTDINGVSSIEEQIASIQEGTDISSIIDEEVDE